MTSAAPGVMPSRIRAYRILKRKFVATAFSGQGARLFGGRWNSPGVGVVYTAGAVSLGILEWRVHLTQWPAPPHVLIEIDPQIVPRGNLEVLDMLTKKPLAFGQYVEAFVMRKNGTVISIKLRE